MNERIQQLAEQAGMYVDLNGNPWPKWMSAEECKVVYKKFAELIVRECISSVGSQADKAYLKKHFGLPIESDIHYPAGESVEHMKSQYNRELNLIKQ